MVKVLIIGLGSIGERHVLALRQCGVKAIAALRTKRGQKRVELQVHEVACIDSALEFAPDGVIIANPTSEHVSSALPFLQQGIKTLIEKPIAECAKTAEQLNRYCELLRVAYCLRFHDLYECLSKIKKSSRIFKMSFRRSHYLPHWHPYADYRKEYAALKRLGGGVARTLSHEVDLMVGLFGMPDAVSGYLDKLSELEMDSDDMAFISCRYDTGLRVDFHRDFLSPNSVNCGEAFTGEAKYTWDTSGIKAHRYDSPTNNIVAQFMANAVENMYFRQAEDFLSFVSTGRSRASPLSDSINVLRIIEAIENV